MRVKCIVRHLTRVIKHESATTRLKPNIEMSKDKKLSLQQIIPKCQVARSLALLNTKKREKKTSQHFSHFICTSDKRRVCNNKMKY